MNKYGTTNFIRKDRNPDVEELQHLIESTGITKKKLAEIAGVVPSSVTRWLTGTHQVPPLVLEKLRQIDKVING